MNKIRGFIDQTEIVKVITGLRRSGKSVMLELIQEELISKGVPRDRMLLYNFENMDLWEFKDPKKLHDFIRSKKKAMKGRTYLFLDEAPEVEQWETCDNSLRVNCDVDIYVTGSNAKMLTGEYATLLAGRYVEIRIYPFSFQEFRAAPATITSGQTDTEVFRRYIRTGGMPFLASFGLNETDSRQYLRDVYASVVIKDILKRNSFRDVDLLERIIAYVMMNIGKTFSATSISRFLKSERRNVAPETVLNYLKSC
jgi:predicted AAA+ superfamily ATPase